MFDTQQYILSVSIEMKQSVAVTARHAPSPGAEIAALSNCEGQLTVVPKLKFTNNGEPVRAWNKLSIRPIMKPLPQCLCRSAIVHAQLQQVIGRPELSQLVRSVSVANKGY